MREEEFQNYLREDVNIISKDKAVCSRVKKARMIERHFGISIDYIVSNNKRMYEFLIRIENELKDTNGGISNALQKYYHFINRVLFLKLLDYK